jgi:hypothetical protein
VTASHLSRLDACSVAGLWAERGGYVEECRALPVFGLTGTLPTELGTLTALTYLCVRCPRPPRLHACAVTGLWTECGGDVGVQGSTRQPSRGHTQRSRGHTAHRAGHADCADLPVRAPPSPTAPGSVRRYRVVG